MSWRRTVLGSALVGFALASLAPTPAAAEVRTRTRADGTIEVYNDGPSFALSPGRALQLRPVPQPVWEEWIRTHASTQGLDPRLVQALMQAESAYNPRAVSRKGAIGLMQLMPATARDLAVPDPYDPEQNIRGGVTYLRQMLDLFDGRVELALAAYNAGPGAVQRHHGIPPYAETQQYVQRVLTLYRGSGMLVGLSAVGGPARPHGLEGSVVPTPLQRALAGGVARRETPTGPAAASSALVAAAAARRPGPAAPATASPRGGVVTAAAAPGPGRRVTPAPAGVAPAVATTAPAASAAAAAVPAMAASGG